MSAPGALGPSSKTGFDPNRSVNLAAGTPPEPSRSSLFRWYVFYPCSEFQMYNRIHRPVLNLGSRGIISEKIVGFPVSRWSNRSLGKTATAVWANIPQNVFDTFRTERTFVGADASVQSMRRQWPVAVLTGRSQLEHLVSLFGSKMGNCPVRPARVWQLSTILRSSFRPLLADCRL
jgi:hypothetical protein